MVAPYRSPIFSLEGMAKDLFPIGKGRIGLELLSLLFSPFLFSERGVNERSVPPPLFFFPFS